MKSEFLAWIVLMAMIFSIPGRGMAKEANIGHSVRLLENVRNRHPRLLFSPEEVQDLRNRAYGVSAGFFKELEGYTAVSKPPDHRKFLTDGTDAQRQGLWRAPTAGLHYVITGDKASFDNAKGFLELFLGLEHWETGIEFPTHGDLPSNILGRRGERLLISSGREYEKVE